MQNSIIKEIIREEIYNAFRNRGIKLDEYLGAKYFEIDGKDSDIMIGQDIEEKTIFISIKDKGSLEHSKYIVLTKDEAKQVIDALQKVL